MGTAIVAIIVGSFIGWLAARMEDGRIGLILESSSLARQERRTVDDLRVLQWLEDNGEASFEELIRHLRDISSDRVRAALGRLERDTLVKRGYGPKNPHLVLYYRDWKFDVSGE